MDSWQVFCLEHMTNAHADLKMIREAAAAGFAGYGIYPLSIKYCRGSFLFILKDKTEKKLVILYEGDLYNEFAGENMIISEAKIKVCPMNHFNCLIIRREFPYTAPVPVLKNHKTIGLGDRLGLATPGHIKLIKNYEITPVFAQQSIRELNLTSRTYENVLDDASWAVFQEDYRDGFGADGDHLKTADDIVMALDCGFSMITLDCSDHIDNSVANLDDDEIEKLFASIAASNNEKLVKKYLADKFILKNGRMIEFSLNEIKRIILTYKAAVDFAISIYQNYLQGYQRAVDFEISIDETLTSTSPQAHYFVAAELTEAGVDAATIAPRFCGEFQKGIDYIGSADQFEQEFKVHTAIADTFGYKLSIHSGSDKFTVFPVIGRETRGRFHVKTAGTNWLEAVRVIACKDPSLYREIHRFALASLDSARAYYHIGAEVSKIPDIDTVNDEMLPELLNKPDSRQVLHITYGLILSAKNADGNSRFKTRIYALLYEYEEVYADNLIKHIGRHLTDLGLCPKQGE